MHSGDIYITILIVLLRFSTVHYSSMFQYFYRSTIVLTLVIFYIIDHAYYSMDCETGAKCKQLTVKWLCLLFI